jgi:23S rRNA pseudouridine2605 synthase
MKKKTGFEKFHKVKSGSALKEQIRQEKKKITKERKEYFEAKRQEKYGQPSAGGNQHSDIRSSASERKTTNYKLKIKNPGLQAAAPQMPLNKYIAHSGVCSRRDAAELIKSGKVKLNGEIVTEPGRKVTEKDVVIVGNKKVYPVADLVYILLNKPKDYLTTTDDPQQRKTVLDLIVGATKDRVYPVGRLDRNTSGVLLLTNDGELAQKLTHPSNEIKKVYAVTLDKPLEKKHFDEILKGVALEDGMAHVDILAYTDAQDKTQIGVEIHSGRNRIVRRIFEKFGYDVKGLDRVMFAGLTKKNVNRGRWRYLNEKEVRDLKYFKKGK